MTVAARLLADSDFGGHMGDWGAGWWILMMLLMVVFWGLVIVGVVLLIRSLGGEPDHRAAGAEELLDRRLAGGEISPEDYRRRRAVLRGDSGAAPDEAAGRERGG